MATKLVCTPRQPPTTQAGGAASLGAGSLAGDSLALALRLLQEQGEKIDVTNPAVIAVVARKRWPGTKVRLRTAFMDASSPALKRKILKHLNMWNQRANVQFVESALDPQVRITRLGGPTWGGYWSYIGTDILRIPKHEPTMNLEAFTLGVPDSEYRRVVCHEAGHTLGFPHEHMRRAFVQRIDRQKAYAYFRRTDGWSPADVDQQVLTPLNEASLIGTAPDQTSIMCYQLPGSITKDGRPILGGLAITRTDHAFAARLHPKPAAAKKRRMAAKKTAKKTASKKTASKKTASKKTTAKRTTAKRSTARRTATRKSASKQRPARKAAAKRTATRRRRA